MPPTPCLFDEPESRRLLSIGEDLIESLEASERWSAESCDQLRGTLVRLRCCGWHSLRARCPDACALAARSPLRGKQSSRSASPRTLAMDDVRAYQPMLGALSQRPGERASGTVLAVGFPELRIPR